VKHRKQKQIRKKRENTSAGADSQISRRIFMRRRKYAEKKSASQNRRHIHSAQTTPENSRIFEYNWYLWLFVLLSYTGWPKKVSHYQMVKKLYYIVLKSVSEIRFIRHITV